MKIVLTRIVLFPFLFVLFISNLAFAGIKIFIKEYTYQASEDDSRNSSRVIALREVKRLLLEELGTYLESETEVRNFQLTRDQITTLTAGIVQTEIVAEKWDGRLYWLKSKISADSDRVVQSINELRKDREKTKELESMRQKSDELLREVEQLRKEMASGKNGNRVAQKAAYDKSINELSAAEWIEKGQAANDFEDAAKAYSRAIELDPSNIEAYYFRARSSEKNSAMSDYYKLLTIAPKNSESHLIRAWTYKELDNRDLALKEFGKAIETASGSKEKATAYFERGRYYTVIYVKIRSTSDIDTSSMEEQQNRAMELAIQDFSRAIELDPKESSYYSWRAGWYSVRKYEQALQDYGTAIKLDPNSAGHYASRGQLLVMIKKPELAIADFSRAIELGTKDSIFLTSDYYWRATTYEKLGRFDLAIRDWSTLIEREPDDPSKYRERADLYGKVGKYDLAIQDYNEAIKLVTNNELAYYGRAKVYALKRNFPMAIKDLKKTMQLDPYFKYKAQKEPAFDTIREHPDFIKLIGE